MGSLVCHYVMDRARRNRTKANNQEMVMAAKQEVANNQARRKSNLSSINIET